MRRGYLQYDILYIFKFGFFTVCFLMCCWASLMNCDNDVILFSFKVSLWYVFSCVWASLKKITRGYSNTSGIYGWAAIIVGLSKSWHLWWFFYGWLLFRIWALIMGTFQEILHSLQVQNGNFLLKLPIFYPLWLEYKKMVTAFPRPPPLAFGINVDKQTTLCSSWICKHVYVIYQGL